MDMDDLVLIQQKKDLRKMLKEKRKHLDASYCREADRKIRLILQSAKVYQEAELIFCYVSMEGEPETRQFIQEALDQGKRIAVPRCREKGRMDACEIRSLDDLESGAFGIWEPKAECPLAEPEKLQVCVVPCLSCSGDGIRLGYGGGYYDRFLPMTEAVRIILCREQMLCQEIPVQPHDCKMDILITETGFTVL